MTQATRQAFITSQTIAVEHIRISSERSFAEVRRKLEDTVPKRDTGIAEALRSGDQKRARSRHCLAFSISTVHPSSRVSWRFGFERSKRRIVLALYGVDGSLHWRDLQTGGGALPASATADDPVEFLSCRWNKLN
jgi:hypothetical protein